MNNVPLGIIIPVYNESDNIGKTLSAIEERIKTPHRIYIVYDFDEDNTIPVAKKFQKNIDLHFLKNPLRGVASAIKTGLREAREKFLLVTMADMSDDYAVVDTMCRKAEKGYDVICGSRYIRGGKQIGGPLIKKTLSRIAGVSLKYISGLPTHDVTNSFKLYRRSLLKSLTLESDGGFEIGMEIAVKAHFGGFKVTEVPSVWRDRQQGKSRFRIIQWAPKYLRWYLYAVRKRFSL
jgi:dolichol-phosphate mannosyltransferase